MCYIIFGAINKEINHEDYENALKGSKYTFKIGTKHNVKMCAVNNTYEYRVTDWVCDCEFPVGNKDEGSVELKELADLINKLRDARNSKFIYISKNWAGKRNKSEKNIHINDIEIIPFLANMESNCLYKIDFH